jgi:hypothetical protein
MTDIKFIDRESAKRPRHGLKDYDEVLSSLKLEPSIRLRTEYQIAPGGLVLFGDEQYSESISQNSTEEPT